MRKPSRPPHLFASPTSPELTALQSVKGLTSNKYFVKHNASREERKLVFYPEAKLMFIVWNKQ